LSNRLSQTRYAKPRRTKGFRLSLQVIAQGVGPDILKLTKDFTSPKSIKPKPKGGGKDDDDDEDDD
jgi:hypothetical protein